MSGTSLSEQLRSAFHAGAEIGLARALASSDSATSVAHFVQMRLPGLSADDLAYIKGFAERMLSAGDYLASVGPEEEIDPDQIPINPEPNPDDWQGGRLRWVGEWNIPGQDEWYKFGGTLPDITDFGDIAAFAANLASSYIDAYPGKFSGIGGGIPLYVNVRIIAPERAF